MAKIQSWEAKIHFRHDSYRWKLIDTSQGENQKTQKSWGRNWFSPWLVSMESSSIQTMAKIFHRYKSRRKLISPSGFLDFLIFAMTRIDGNSSIQTMAKIILPYKSWRKLKTERPKCIFATTRIDEIPSIQTMAKIILPYKSWRKLHRYESRRKLKLDSRLPIPCLRLDYP